MALASRRLVSVMSLLVLLVAVALIIPPGSGNAQPAGRVYRVGMLGLASGSDAPVLAALRQGLRDLGYEEGKNFVIRGGWVLMGYAVKCPEVFRRAAVFIDKIPRGARPGDLPFEQVDRFELLINIKTAKTLGLTIPPSLLLRADQVIE
jgi:hypothetical protein